MAKGKSRAKALTADDLEMKASAVQSCISRIEQLHDEKESKRGAYMNACAKINDRISAIVDEGSRKGIPGRALRAAIRVRAKLQKARDELAKLEAEQAAQAERILRLNDDPSDLPLFAASATPTMRVVRSGAADAETAAVH
jgi:uncharacterized protein (UPF0335 family)